MADIIHALLCVFSAARYLNISPAVMGLYQKVTGAAPLLAALKGRFRLSTFLRKHHDFTISLFHLFTNSRIHKFTNSISRNDAIALYLAADGNHLTAVAVAAWTA